MNKPRFLLSLAFCSSFLNVAFADSLDTLLNDVNKRIALVEKTGTCSIGNPAKWSSCEPITAKCPIGTKLVSALSRCDFFTVDGEKINTGGGNYMPSMLYPNNKSNVKDGQQECSAFNMASDDVNVKATAACAKLPKALPTILKRFGVNDF
jgi:hypothetical protein